MERRNLAGRAGSWSAAHWKRALFGWLVLAVAAMAVGSVAGHVQMADSQCASGEAATALRLLEQGGLTPPAAESVLLQSHAYTVDDPIFMSALGAVIQTLSSRADIADLQNPLLNAGGGGQISRDRHSVLVQFAIA